ncbi:MAG: tetratricopeptide repeat protein [Verrucomicrobiota bacterium]
MRAQITASVSRISKKTVNYREAFEQGYALQQAGKWLNAIPHYEESIRLSAANAAAHNNLGNCFRSLGQFQGAIDCFNRALEIEPGRPSSCLNRALANLSLCNYGQAWADYESRLTTIPFRSELLNMPERRWRGQKMGDQGILYLFGNQGLGDELQCLRFLPEVARRVGRVILEAQSPMMSLLKEVPANVTVIERGDPVPPFHQWVEWFSLPGLFQVEIDSIPSPEPVAFMPKQRVIQHIEEAHAKFPKTTKVGMVWTGNPENSLNSLRSLQLEKWGPILRIENAQFFSLQVGDPSAELSESPLCEEVVDLSPVLDDFAATATAIKALDLIITTDTSVPHLAGTLGKETWLMLHQPCDWRWGQHGMDTPWYPSIRAFRQSIQGQWDPVVNAVAASLEAKAHSSREKA